MTVKSVLFLLLQSGKEKSLSKIDQIAQVIQNDVAISRSILLIPSAESLAPRTVAYPQITGIIVCRYLRWGRRGHDGVYHRRPYRAEMVAGGLEREERAAAAR